jgi:hypothetical protein
VDWTDLAQDRFEGTHRKQGTTYKEVLRSGLKWGTTCEEVLRNGLKIGQDLRKGLRERTVL